MKVWVLNPPFHKKYSRPQRSPAVTKSGTIYFPMWLAYCVGVLEKNDFDVTFTDAPARGLDIDDILQLAQKEKPALVVMDTSTPSINNDANVAGKIQKMLPETFIVMVGTHVSALPEETLNNAPAVHAVARGEYEYTVRDLAKCLNHIGSAPPPEALREIEGLSFRDHETIVHAPDRDLIANLDELPWVSCVYKKHLCIADYFNQNALYPMVTLVTSRGCPFRCSFCVYPQVLTGRKYRFRSIEDVANELEYIMKEFPEARSIFFEDDTLTAHKKRCLEFSEALIARNLTLPWQANSRVDPDYETLKKVRQAGCRELCVGFESGDEAVLKSMRKGTHLEKMRQFMHDAHKAGVLVHGCFMVGLPAETPESIEKTIRFAMELNPDTVQFYPVMVYPGTEAYEEYKEKGWLTTQDYDQWITPKGLHNCVVQTEYMTAEELVQVCDEARRRFYLRPRYLFYKAMQLVRHPSEIGRTAKAARVFFKYLLKGSDV